VALPVTLVCPILLTFDLTKPLRFWHMLVNTTEGDFGLNFNSGTPMSVGVWALLVASVFALVSFVDALVRDGKISVPIVRRVTGALVGKVWDVAGAVVFLFIAGYTGVLLAVSNQPIWSDTWALGGLFLASGLSGSAALLMLLMRYRQDAAPSRGFLELGERLFAALELLLLCVLVLTLISDGTLDEAFDAPWIPLWLIAIAGMLPGLTALAGHRLELTAGGAATVERAKASMLTPVLILAGVLALRAAVIFSAQA
jgi:formate-dependent nitrite reductase membrane component NrfD